MKLTELFIADLDREAARSRKALEEMPEGKQDWKPHDKSMAFGYLSELVAIMPSWISMGIDKDELDLNPPGGSNVKRTPLHSRADYSLYDGMEVRATPRWVLSHGDVVVSPDGADLEPGRGNYLPRRSPLLS